jgi:hypothetical protein
VKIKSGSDSIWDAEEMPKEWNVSLVCPVLKNGVPLICSNYRGVSLLKVAYKVLSNVLCE